MWASVAASRLTRLGGHDPSEEPPLSCRRNIGTGRGRKRYKLASSEILNDHAADEGLSQHTREPSPRVCGHREVVSDRTATYPPSSDRNQARSHHHGNDPLDLRDRFQSSVFTAAGRRLVAAFPARTSQNRNRHCRRSASRTASVAGSPQRPLRDRQRPATRHRWW